MEMPFSLMTRQNSYVSIRQHTSAYARIRQHTSAYLAERLFGDAVFVDDAPELIEAAVGVKEREIRLADNDVVGRGVVVELLVPFLDKRALT